jgi:hypothetical protein
MGDENLNGNILPQMIKIESEWKLKENLNYW